MTELWRQPIRPTWFAFRTAPQRELQAEAWLRTIGVSEAFYPAEVRLERCRYKPGRLIPKSYPIAPGYLFAFLDREPHWHELFPRSMGKLIGVISRGAVPAPITEEAIMNMAALPDRLASMRERKRRAAMIHAGDKAQIVTGRLAGWTVEITEVRGQSARFLSPLFSGVVAEIPLSSVAKVCYDGAINLGEPE